MKSMEGAVWRRFDLVDGLQQFISESQKIRMKNEAVNVAAALIKIRMTQIEQKLGRWSYKIINRSSVIAINYILSNNRHRDPSLTFPWEKRICEKHRWFVIATMQWLGTTDRLLYACLSVGWKKEEKRKGRENVTRLPKNFSLETEKI